MDLKEIFARNLCMYMKKTGHSQVDIAEYLNVSPAAVSTWCTARKIPRMDKIERLANYFGIPKSDLIEDKALAASTENDGLNAYLEELKNRADQLENVYFNFAKEAQDDRIDPEDIRLALDTIKRLREKK